MVNSYIQVAVSCSSSEEAEQIVKHLLQQKLIACGQIIPQMQSLYHWQGQIESSSECLMLMKTKLSLFEAVETEIKLHHSYEVPEIIAIPLVAISPTYQNWIDEEVKD